MSKEFGRAFGAIKDVLCTQLQKPRSADGFGQGLLPFCEEWQRGLLFHV